jgi:hypothetical protein
MPRRLPRHTNGRPTLLTPDLQQRIVELVQAGNYLSTAAEAAGIARRTLYQWLALGLQAQNAIDRGERITPTARRYAQFAHTLSRVRARAEAGAVLTVTNAMRGGAVVRETTRRHRDGSEETERLYAPPDGRLALEYLARTAPARWGRRQAVEVSGPGGGPVEVEHGISDDAAALAARVHANMARQREEEDRVVAGEVIPPLSPAGVIETEQDMAARVRAKVDALLEAHQLQEPEQQAGGS